MKKLLQNNMLALCCIICLISCVKKDKTYFFLINNIDNVNARAYVVYNGNTVGHIVRIYSPQKKTFLVKVNIDKSIPSHFSAIYKESILGGWNFEIINRYNKMTSEIHVNDTIQCTTDSLVQFTPNKDDSLSPNFQKLIIIKRLVDTLLDMN